MNTPNIFDKYIKIEFQELESFSQYAREWERYLTAADDMANPNWVWVMEEPSSLPKGIKESMTSINSDLFNNIGGLMLDKGVEIVLRYIVSILGGFSYLASMCNNNAMKEYTALRELMVTGDTFLQLLSDKAMEMGCNPMVIKTIFRKKGKKKRRLI